LQEFMPAIREIFKASMAYAPRTGGSFSFLKRLHVLEAGYSQLHIYVENKHIKQAYDLYSQHSKPPRVMLPQQRPMSSRPKTRQSPWSLLSFLSFVLFLEQCFTLVMRDVMCSSQPNVWPHT